MADSEPLTNEEMSLLRDALWHYREDRRKVARRRDRKEGGSAVERALGDFFRMCDRLDIKLLVLIRGF
jgi:hypothetical protein